MSPFRNTLWLSLGDLAAKVLNFLALVYLARVLGVADYGAFEFAITVLTYFTLLADAGLEVWSLRETARGANLQSLVSRTLFWKSSFAALALVILIVALPLFPAYPGLRSLLLILGAVLVIQALNLKWVFLGQEKMRWVATGLVFAQVFFSVGMFRLVSSPEDLSMAAWVWLVSEIISSLFFGGLYFRVHGFKFAWPGWSEAAASLKPALSIGLMQAMGIMNYNFDSLLLGFLAGAEPVGWYKAAYKPITAVLGLPLTYFAGLLPALTRAFTASREEFWAVFERSLRLTLLCSLPIAIGGTFLAQPIIDLLYGPDYAQSVLILKILAWSAAMVVFRATLRHGLLAVGRQDLALRAALVAVSLNILLNSVLISKFGMLGAAFTTVFSDLAWLTISIADFNRVITRLNWISYLFHPLLAGGAMALSFFLLKEQNWLLQAITGTGVYGMVLVISGEKETRSWIRKLRVGVS
ncbi:MAG: flippase [Anaerolineales bacterium]|jgi:O-antigen/teichoic acid export membrane protein|nr:flippase [Anaerolineales bacterium]